MPDNYSLLAKDIDFLQKKLSEVSGELDDYKKQNSEAIKELRMHASQEYVRRIEFEPVQKILYGMVSLVLIGVLSALMGLIIIK